MAKWHVDDKWTKFACSLPNSIADNFDATKVSLRLRKKSKKNDNGTFSGGKFIARLSKYLIYLRSFLTKKNWVSLKRRHALTCTYTTEFIWWEIFWRLQKKCVLFLVNIRILSLRYEFTVVSIVIFATFTSFHRFYYVAPKLKFGRKVSCDDHKCARKMIQIYNNNNEKRNKKPLNNIS